MAKWTKITLGAGRVIIKVTIVVGLTHVCSNVANINAKTVVVFDFEFFLVYVMNYQWLLKMCSVSPD